MRSVETRQAKEIPKREGGRRKQNSAFIWGAKPICNL